MYEYALIFLNLSFILKNLSAHKTRPVVGFGCFIDYNIERKNNNNNNNNKIVIKKFSKDQLLLLTCLGYRWNSLEALTTNFVKFHIWESLNLRFNLRVCLFFKLKLSPGPLVGIKAKIHKKKIIRVNPHDLLLVCLCLYANYRYSVPAMWDFRT